MKSNTVVIVCAYNEADRLPDTVSALNEAFPGGRIVVADDASEDGSGEVARAAGAEVVATPQQLGKGGVASLAAEAVLDSKVADDTVFLLCDGDLGGSAVHLQRLTEAVRAGETDLAVAAFARRVGGGFGVALGFARWAIQKRCGLLLDAPISGQRALSKGALKAAVPFAGGFGMEIGMTVDVSRAGYRVKEIELPLEHRATGRTWRGFIHRGRQLLHFARTYIRLGRGR